MSETSLTRRAFAHQFAFGFTGASAVTGIVLAQEATTPKKKEGDATGSEERPLPPEEAYLLGLILRRYPDKRLDEAAVTAIIKDIRGDVIRGRVLSNFPLQNGDEPNPGFRVWRREA